MFTFLTVRFYARGPSDPTAHSGRLLCGSALEGEVGAKGYEGEASKPIDPVAETEEGSGGAAGGQRAGDEAVPRQV